MADFLLSVGVDVGLSYTQMQKDISTLVSQLNSNPPKIKVALDLDNTTTNQLRTQINDISKTLSGSGAVMVGATGVKGVAADMAGVAKSANDAANATRSANAEFKKTQNNINTISKGSKEYYNALKRVQTLLTQVTNNQEKWTAAKSGKSSSAYNDLTTYANELKDLITNLQTGSMTVEQFESRMATLSSNIVKANGTIKAAGENTHTWSQRVGNLSAKFGTWFSITRVIMAAYRAVREMVTVVIELDTAMTELKKVTDETDAAYERFLNNAATRAKQLGATMSDVVTASADFARLGYGIEDAEKLADAAIVYKNVGDGIDDINTASESIIATMQAFGVPAEEAMKIVDKFNEVGNNYAISSKGVGDALLRSAAAMHAANNSLDETIALAAAANTIVQDPEKVGTTLKTVSMYLRAAKTEAEEAGESTDGMAGSVSELRDEILALTGNKVDIQIDEDNFKSTYQILKELSVVWDDLTDISQANILEMVGGKRNSNVVAAILDNFTVAENALLTSTEAVGSALAENEKYLSSIEGRVSIFKATFEEFSNTLIQGSFVKDIVDFGTNLLNVLNAVAKIIDVIGGLNTVLVATVGVIATIKANAIVSFLTKALTGIGTIVPALKTFKTTLFELPLAMKIAKSEGQGLAAAFDLVGISASTAQIAVATFMIAITLITAVISKYNQAQQAARDAAIEHASVINQNNSKTEEYKNKIIELRGALDDGNLSEAAAYDARSQLVEIEKSLIDLFGKEAEGIDTVTGSINEQIAAIDALSEADWNEYVKKNTGAINKVVDIFTDFSPQDLDFWNSPINGDIEIKALSSGVLQDAINDLDLGIIPAEFHDRLQQELEDANIGIEIPIAGITGDFTSDINADTVYEYLEVYQKLYDITEELSKEYFGENYMDYAGDSLAAYSARINELSTYISESEGMFDTYVQGLLMYEDKYTDIYAKALAAKKEYDKAVLEGDDDAAAAALSKMQGVQEDFLSAGWDNDAVNLYMNEFFEAFNDASKQHQGLIEIETVLKNPEDAATKAAVEAAKVFANESGKVSVEAILSAGIDYEKTGEATTEQAQAYIKLKALADEYGLSVESVIGVMAGLGLITTEVLEAPVNDFDKAKDAATSFLTSLQGVQKILSSQPAGQSISIDDFNAEGMEDYREALEYTNGAMQLNAEKVREITEAKAEEEKQTIATNKALAQDQYLKNAQQIEKYRQKLADANYEGDETEETVRASIEALLDENSALADTCKQYDLLSASITEATSAYSHWLNAQSASDYGDMADDAVSAIEKIRGTYDSNSEDYGNFGSKKFTAAIEFIVPETVDQDDLAAVEMYMQDFQQYLTFDDDGGVTGLNVDQFLSKAVEEGLMSYSEDDGFQVLGGKKMEDFAKGLTMSSGMVTAFFDELQLKGAEFDWGDEGVKTFGDLAVEANEAAEALRLVEANKDLQIRLDVSGADLKTEEERVKALETTITSMNTIKGRVNVSAEEVEYANSVIQYCIAQKQLLTQPDVMRVDTSQCEGDIANVIKLLQDFQSAQNNLEIQQSLGMDTTEAQTSVDGLYADIQALSPEIKTTLGIDTTSVKALQTSLAGVTAEVLITYGVNAEAVNGYNPESKTCDVIYNPKTDLLPQSFDDISVSVYYDPDTDDLPTYFKTITRYVNYVAIGDSKVQGTAHAGGTAAAGGDWGTALGGHTLVGELGREIVVDPRTGRWYTVGDHGAEFVNIPAGAIVFNHKQTESLLNYGYVSGRAAALVSGTAMVTGGYKPYKPTGGYSSGSSGSRISNTGSSASVAQKSTSNTHNTKDEESEFERLYKYHQHLLEMDAESTADYLKWLNNAYKKAYQNNEIELEDYYKYEEEVYQGLQELFKDYLNDVEHEISMRENYEGESDKIIKLYKKLMKDVEKEITAARAQGLDDTDDYIQELQSKWQDYAKSVKDIQEDATESAKDAIAELVDYRIDMIKQDIENEKDALDKKLDYLKEFYDKQKDMLQDQYDEEQYLKEQAEKRKSVSDLRSEIAMLENDNSAWAQKRKLELQEELAAAEDDLGTFEDEHALDLALDALDNAYSAQEAQIQAEMDALEEKLNNPNALYNQALTEIKNNTGNLYQEMIKYNRKYGTGNDEDVKDVYEEAYKALLEYKDVYGKDYKGVVLTNSTKYKPNTGSWDAEKISGTNPNNQKKEETKTTTTKKKETKSTAPSLSKGSTITVKKSATHFGSMSDGVRMASFVPGGSYTVYQTSGNQVLIGRNGVYTGWINKSDIVGYAKGTKNATAGLHSLDEIGSEYLFTSTDGNKYRVLSSGDKVLNARATDFLYEFANGGQEILEKIIKSAFGSSLFDHIQPVVNHNEIDMGNIIVQGSATQQTVSEIRRAQRDNLTEMLKSLNKLNK